MFRHLPSMVKALGSFPSKEDEEKKKRKRKRIPCIIVYMNKNYSQVDCLIYVSLHAYFL